MNKSGGTAPIQSIKTCVIYESESGLIRHRHTVVTLVGGREPAPDQIAADARRAFGDLPNAPGSALDVLHVHHEAIEPGRRYRVDPGEKKLVLQG
jgi:hypothetical protein